MLVSGDWAAYFVANCEKPKLAAMEVHFTTKSGVPLVIGGWPDPASGNVLYGIRIPKLLSVLAIAIRSILHTDYSSTCAKLASFGLQND